MKDKSFRGNHLGQLARYLKGRGMPMWQIKNFFRGVASKEELRVWLEGGGENG